MHMSIVCKTNTPSNRTVFCSLRNGRCYKLHSLSLHCFGMSLSHIVSFHVDRDFVFCCFRISPPLRCQGTMSPDAWTDSLYGFVMSGRCVDGLVIFWAKHTLFFSSAYYYEPKCLNSFLVWFRHVCSLCRWFGHFPAESYTLFFPVLTIIPSNVCFLSRSCNSKLSPFSCSASRTSMMIINTIGTALVVIFCAISGKYSSMGVLIVNIIFIGSLVDFRCRTHFKLSQT